MSTIRNTVDIALQGTDPRIVSINLPGNITVPWGQIPGGSGKSADYATNDYDFVNTVYPADKLNVQGQLYGKIESWFQTANPADSWIATDTLTAVQVKALHTGDTWFNTTTTVKKLYRYNGTEWDEITDKLATDAYANASTAQSTADGKAIVFVGTTNPTNYDIGDLWDSLATPRNLKSATTASATYNSAHWVVVSTLNLGDFANLDGKITPENRDLYLANNCTSYAITTNGTIHEIVVHGSAEASTSILLTGAIYMTTSGGSVNTTTRLNVKKWNGSSWQFLDNNGGNTIFDQATISMTSAGGARVPFHLTLTCSESAQYQFSLVAYADVLAISEPSITTLEVVK